MIHIEDPPESRQFRSDVDWPAVAEAIAKAKGKFHFIGVFSPGVATHIRNGRYKVFLPARGCDDPKDYMTTHYKVTTRSIPSEGGGKRVNLWIKRLR